MTKNLVLIDHDGNKVAKSAAELATFAKRAGNAIGLLLANSGSGDSLAAQLNGTEFERVLIEYKKLVFFIMFITISLKQLLSLFVVIT